MMYSQILLGEEPLIVNVLVCVLKGFGGIGGGGGKGRSTILTITYIKYICVIGYKTIISTKTKIIFIIIQVYVMDVHKLQYTVKEGVIIVF